MESIGNVLANLLFGSICIQLVGIIFYYAIRQTKRDKIPVRRLNCESVVSHGRWRKSDGCFACGSDLFELQQRL